MENLNTHTQAIAIHLKLETDERIAIWQAPEQDGFRIRIATEMEIYHDMREECAENQDHHSEFYLDYANKIQACEETDTSVKQFIHAKPYLQIYADNMDTIVDWLEDNALQNEFLCFTILNQLVELNYIEIVDKKFNPIV